MIKTPKEFLDERLVIQEGQFKGARRTVSEHDVIAVAEAYHAQFEQEQMKELCPDCGSSDTKFCSIYHNHGVNRCNSCGNEWL